MIPLATAQERINSFEDRSGRSVTRDKEIDSGIILTKWGM
jgi:hypothetical protein